VKQSDLGKYEENVRENQNIQYTRQKHQLPPQTKPYGWQIPIPLQISKSRRIKWFGENVDQLSLGAYVSHLNVPLLYMISQKVVSPLNKSHLFVKDWIFGYRDGTGVIAHEGNSPKPHSKIFHGVHYPKNL
jgi:hypothetical protein